MELQEPKKGNRRVTIDLSDPLEKKVEILKALFHNLHEEKRLLSQEETFLIDQLRDVLNPLGWDIVRRPAGARPRPTSDEKTLKKIIGGTPKKRRKSRG